MASRTKDVNSFYKQLQKRFGAEGDAALDVVRELERFDGRKLLELLALAIFLENGSLARAFDSFDKIEDYFIDWNEIRVAKASEIAEVVEDDSLQRSERLRRVLQMIFDKIYKFDLEEYRVQGREAFDAFLDEIPYSTPFMKAFVDFFAYEAQSVPLDERMLQALRLLGFVEVKDGAEVVPSIEEKMSANDRRVFFCLMLRFGEELASEDPTARDGALKFLASFDKASRKRSSAPLVSPKWPSDPKEIAKLLAKDEREKSRRNSSSIKKNMLDWKDESDDEEEDEQSSFLGENEGEGDASDVQSGATLTMSKDGVSLENAPDAGAVVAAAKSSTHERERGKSRDRRASSKASSKIDAKREAVEAAPVADSTATLAPSADSDAPKDSKDAPDVQPQAGEDKKKSKPAGKKSASRKKAEPEKAPEIQERAPKSVERETTPEPKNDVADESQAPQKKSSKRVAKRKSKETVSETADGALSHDSTNVVATNVDDATDSAAPRGAAKEEEPAKPKRASKPKRAKESEPAVAAATKVSGKASRPKSASKTDDANVAQSEPPDASPAKDGGKTRVKATSASKPRARKAADESTSAASNDTSAKPKRARKNTTSRDDASTLKDIQQKKPR